MIFLMYEIHVYIGDGCKKCADSRTYSNITNRVP